MSNMRQRNHRASVEQKSRCARFNPGLETLEDRRLLSGSAQVFAGRLLVLGTPADDAIVITRDPKAAANLLEM